MLSLIPTGHARAGAAAARVCLGKGSRSDGKAHYGAWPSRDQAIRSSVCKIVSGGVMVRVAPPTRTSNGFATPGTLRRGSGDWTTGCALD
jgi:hypothetical protein